MKGLLALSFILCAAAPGCDDAEEQTPCERAAEMKIECELNGEGDPADLATVCESGTINPEAWECTIDCAETDDCDEFVACDDECY